MTSSIDARPDFLLMLPGPSWLPVFAGLGTAAFFLFLTVKWFIPSALGAAVALASIFKWLWESEPAPSKKLYPVGGGIELPDHMIGSRSHSWWAMVVLMLVDGTIFSCLVFAFFYFWTITEGWPPAPYEVPSLTLTVAASLLWIGSSAILAFASRSLSKQLNRTLLSVLLIAAILLVAAAFFVTLQTLSTAQVAPSEHSYGAVIYTLLSWQGLHGVLLVLMGGYTIARNLRGMIDTTRRNTFDNTRLMWHYTVAQGVIALAVMQVPRLVS